MSKELLEKMGWFDDKGNVMCPSPYVWWVKDTECKITLDGEFAFEELEALVNYIKMRNERKKNGSSG